MEWLPFPPPGDLPDLEIKLGSRALQEDSLPSEPWGRPMFSRVAAPVYMEEGFLFFTPPPAFIVSGHYLFLLVFSPLCLV